MRIALISDLHLGLTTEGQIKQMLRALQKEQFDVLVNAGDNNGGSHGGRATKRVAAMIRKHFPNTPIMWVNSNHDRWCYTKKRVLVGGKYIEVRPGPESYHENMDQIRSILKDNNIHYLDKDGVYTDPNFPLVTFIGASGWYNNPNPPTNDAYWLPIGMDGDTNRYILKETEDDLFRAEAELISMGFDKTVETLVVVSHFPIVKEVNDRSFEDFCWREALSEFFIREYWCKHFLSGHSHKRKEGPMHFNCGSDYYNPKFLIIDV